MRLMPSVKELTIQTLPTGNFLKNLSFSLCISSCYSFGCLILFQVLVSFKFMTSSIRNIKRCAEKAHLFILYSGGDMMGACRLLRPCFYIPLELCLSLRVKFSLKRKKRTILNSKNGLWITQKWLQIPF